MSFVLSILGARFRQLRVELGWIVGGQLFAFLGAIAAIKVLTMALGTEGYGELALGLTIAGISHMLIYGPLEQTVLRFTSSYRDRGELGGLWRQLSEVHLQVAVALAVGTFSAGILILTWAGPVWAAVIALGVAFGTANGWNASINSLLNALRSRQIVALHQAAEPWIRLALALALFELWPKRGDTALLGFTLGLVVIGASQAIAALRRHPALRDRRDETAERSLRAQFLSYGSPFVLFALFSAMTTYADRWILLASLGTAAVGVYAALYQIANAPIMLFTGITNQLFVPMIFERASRQGEARKDPEARRLIGFTVRLYAAGMTAFVVAAWFLGTTLMKFFTAPGFAEHGNLLWLVALGLAVASIGQVLVLEGLALGESRSYVVPKAIQALSFLVSALLLVEPLGIAGIAWALCLSSVCYVTAVAAVNRRLLST